MVHHFITDAEEKYRLLLAGECSRLFSGSDIPSHDHLHHERVWNNAALLLGRLYEAGMVTDSGMAYKAIIASFFHDTGLTINRGPDHGRESSQICSVFLDAEEITGADRLEILDAIEKHDKKDYSGNSDPASLASILTVADDIDAFGEKAIGRYKEIYSMRGIPEEDIPGMIVTNVLSRLRHLESTYPMFPDLIEEMKARAKTVINHFTIQAS